MAETQFGGTDRAIRWTTTPSVIVLAVIAAIVSYRHMYLLVRRYGETSWTAALLPISVDGMIVVSSMSLLMDSRHGRRSGVLPWALLIIGSAASLAANVAVAEPVAIGRLIAGWPSCALIGSYELLMRQMRYTSMRQTSPESIRSYVRHRASDAGHTDSETPHISFGVTVAPSYESLTSTTLRVRPRSSKKSHTDGDADLIGSSDRSWQGDTDQIRPQLRRRPGQPAGQQVRRHQGLEPGRRRETPAVGLRRQRQPEVAQGLTVPSSPRGLATRSRGHHRPPADVYE